MRRAPYLALALVLLAGGALVASQLIGSDGSPFAADAADLRATEARLGVVVEDLRKIPPIAGVAVTSLSTLDCRLDSGDLFEPSALAHWEGAERNAASATAAVADALRSSGWTVSGEPSPSGASASTNDFDGWSASGFVGPMPERGGAYVDVVIVDAAPCSLTHV